MSPQELKTLRLKRGWKLRDVAIPLGVTEASLSRWERDLQTPPPAMLASWERLLTGQTRVAPARSSPRRKPRGVIPRLAELFLADVKAGLNGWQAGWREVLELNLTADDLPGLESDIERDEQGRIRIRHDSRLEAVQQAKDILGYRNTRQDEERLLLPAIEKLVCPVLDEIRGLFGGALLFAGLWEMINASASSVETARNMLDNDPTSLVDAPSGGAISILEALQVSFDVSALPQDLMPRDRRPALIDTAKGVASELGLDQVARQLGETAVTAVSAAWAVNRRLTFAGVTVATDDGARYLAETFWNRIGKRRAEVDTIWRRIMIEEFEPQSEKDQIGMLLWSWPEVL